jgi:hypothetical protein
MRYTTKDIHLPISKLQGFTSSGAVRGEWLDPARTVYGVFSYQTLMLAMFRDVGKAFLNANRYSVTTSKHQGKIRQGVSLSGFLSDEIPARDLEELLEARGANSRAYEWASPRD